MRNNFLRDKNIVMKTFKNLKNSIILLAIFLLCAGFSRGILRPANANPIQSVFEIITAPDVHLGNWVQNIFWSTAMNAPLKLACGGEKDMDAIFVQKKPCLTEDEMNNIYSYVEDGRMPGGLFAMSTYTLGQIINEPTIPTNLAMYIDDVKGNSIFNDNAYAATGYSKPSDFFQASTLSVWKATRNLSLSLLGLFLAIAALGVLFRQKLSPQAVVTIYSILPSVPLAILFIVLSYPIVAVAMNLAIPLLQLSIKLGLDIFKEIAQGVSSGAVPTPVGGWNLFTVMISVMASLFGSVANIVISIPIVLLVIATVILLVTLVIRAIYEFAKWYGTFVILTIGFPVAAVMSILPGKQAVLMTFIKKLLVNMLVFPVGVLLLFVGFGFMMTVLDPALTFTGGVGYILNFGIFVTMVKFLIGFGIAWSGFKIRGTLENALGAGGSVISILQGGGGDDKKPGRR